MKNTILTIDNEIYVPNTDPWVTEDVRSTTLQRPGENDSLKELHQLTRIELHTKCFETKVWLSTVYLYLSLLVFKRPRLDIFVDMTLRLVNILELPFFLTFSSILISIRTINYFSDDRKIKELNDFRRMIWLLE